MSFELLKEAEANRLKQVLAKQFGEGCRGFLADKVFFVRGNHAWLATRECAELVGLRLNVQQPGLFALTNVQAGRPSRELEGLLRARKA